MPGVRPAVGLALGVVIGVLWSRSRPEDDVAVVALQQRVADHAVVERATAAFEDIIAAERASGAGGNDHFGTGANDRVWNALESSSTTRRAMSST